MLFFFAVVVQVTIVSSIGILGGSPDLVLVLLVAVSLLRPARSSAPSRASGPGSSLDVAQLGTLGFTSLLLTLAGFWIGRYGETTGRDRAHAPLLSVAVVTVLYAVGSLILHFLLREPASASVALVHVLPGPSCSTSCSPSPSSPSSAASSARRPERPEVEFVG